MTLPVLTNQEFYAMASPRPREFILKDQMTGIMEWRKFFNTKEGWERSELHRLDGPAKIDKHGSETWYNKGYLHRIGGPAHINRCNDEQEWWIMGQEILNYEMYQKLTRCSDEEILLLKLKWGEIK